MNVFSWRCPFCNKETTIVSETNESVDVHYFNKNSKPKDGSLCLLTRIVVCPNPACKEYTINAELYPTYYDNKKYHYARKEGDKPIHSWILKPQSSAIPQPDYIPESIRNDYNEACAILSLSPKASATLARRCLQGMIRDFWKIKKDTLFEEINELKNQGKINSSTMDSINAVRQIGNIGAHMEKDVNLIIAIDENEAGILIKLLEDLFQDWYIDRYEREERNKRLMQIATEKKANKEESS
jgi:hypothetical protein